MAPEKAWEEQGEAPNYIENLRLFLVFVIEKQGMSKSSVYFGFTRAVGNEGYNIWQKQKQNLILFKDLVFTTSSSPQFSHFL